MKIHLLQIPAEGKHLEGEQSSSILDLRDPEHLRALGPIHYSLDVGRSGGGFFATGQLTVDLELQCVSCLEPFLYPLKVENFACQLEIGSAETVDLTEPIREDILLALPPHPHCDWNGESDCRGAFHRAAENEPLREDRELWGALDQLKLKKTK
jgi:uncharacterized metal-binding protein YceD (DUF177 family)